MFWSGCVWTTWAGPTCAFHFVLHHNMWLKNTGAKTISSLRRTFYFHGLTEFILSGTSTFTPRPETHSAFRCFKFGAPSNRGCMHSGKIMDDACPTSPSLNVSKNFWVCKKVKCRTGDRQLTLCMWSRSQKFWARTFGAGMVELCQWQLIRT